jgi:hypothetical protein
VWIASHLAACSEAPPSASTTPPASVESSAPASQVETKPGTSPVFAREIQPILNRRCVA